MESNAMIAKIRVVFMMFLFPFKLFIHVTKLMHKWYKVNTVMGLDYDESIKLLKHM